MALVLRLRRQVLLPTIWLSEREWRARFLKNPAELAHALDESSATVLEDLGGFARIVESAVWSAAALKPCTSCGAEKSVEDFPLNREKRPGGYIGFSIRGQCWECFAKQCRKYRNPVGVT